MKNQLIVAACVAATLCSSVVFAGATVHPKQGEKPKMSATKPAAKTMASGTKMTTTTKHMKHTKKS